MSWTLWITGPPASGKSALASAVADALARRGVRVALLDLDGFRDVVTPSPAYTDAERRLVYRALVWTARAVAGAGVAVVIDAAAHRREWRDLARATLAPFAEVQLRCPPEVRRARERRPPSAPGARGLYERPGRPGATAPGVDVPHEPSLAPELEIDTSQDPLDTAVTRVVGLAERLGPGGAPRATPAAAGWAIWITGLPGSGKTTIARAVAGALSAGGIPVASLDLAELRAFAAGDRATAPDEEALLHRVLVYAARQLTEVGVPVLVDATAPRRGWREHARRAIRLFAEVQLVCPADVCASRERAVRWGLGPGAAAPAPAGAPEIVLEYETALTPEVIIHTDVEDPWTSTETVLVLARRLHTTVAGVAESAWTRSAHD